MAPVEDDSTTDDRSREELRRQLVEAASERLKGEGIEDFSTTKVAEDCNTSRQMIYTFFGGKPQLLEAVYDYKADELAERFDRVESDDPVERFYELGDAYREFMLEHKALFDTVFSLEATTSHTGPGQIIKRVKAFEYFDEVVEELMEDGFVPADSDPEEITDLLWAAVNGCLRLQILGYYPDEETARDHYFKLGFGVLAGQSSMGDLMAEMG